MTRTEELKSKDTLTLDEFNELYNLDRNFVSWRVTLLGVLGYDSRVNVVKMLPEKSPMTNSKLYGQQVNPSDYHRTISLGDLI